MDSFEEYLIQKKIDPKKFKSVEPEKFEEFNTIFSQLHPNSFTMQKLNLINFIRRKYPLVVEFVSKDGGSETVTGASKVARPVFKKKP